MPFTMIHKSLKQLSKRDFHKLLGCLPFWGLTLKPNGMTKRYSGQIVRCIGLNEDEIKDVQQRLQHTGLQIILSPPSRQSSSHFIISFDSQLSSPIVIHNEKMSYRYQLKPLLTVRPIETSRLIYKNVWLPAQKKTPIMLTINETFRKQAYEWISYLILQYFLNHEETLDLPHISYANFQFFVHSILSSINPIFAQGYLEPSLKLEQWPAFPLENSNKKSADDVSPRKQQQISYSPHLPLFNQQIEQHIAFNPFKHSDSAQSPINPFKNNKN